MKEIPSNDDAERAVLGSILIDPECLQEINLVAEDFFYTRNKDIFAAMKTVDCPDQIAVAHALIDAGGNDTDSIAYLSQLVVDTPTSTHARHYAQIVKDCSVRRGLIELAGVMANGARIGSPDTITKTIKQLVDMNSNRSDGLKPIADISKDHLCEITEWLGGVRAIRGYSMGFKDIDRYINGLEKGKVYIIAGRPSMGKTQFSLNVAKYLAESGLMVAFYTLEQNKNAILERMVYSEARMNRYELRSTIDSGANKEKFWGAWNKIGLLPVMINDATSISTDKILTEVMSQQSIGGLDVLFMDYISLASDTADREVIRLGKIIKNLQLIARLADIPVIATSQLNRASELATNKRPTLSALRESGEIEQLVDVVIGLYREEYYNPDKEHNVLECIILKNRDGARCTVDIFYDTKTGFMSDKAKLKE